MTRKDYIALAEALRAVYERTGDMLAHRSYCGAIASTLAADNHRFNRDRFLADCGLED